MAILVNSQPQNRSALRLRCLHCDIELLCGSSVDPEDEVGSGEAFFESGSIIQVWGSFTAVQRHGDRSVSPAGHDDRRVYGRLFGRTIQS